MTTIAEANRDAITYPVSAGTSAVYATIIDAEGRLIAFVSHSMKSGYIAKEIAEAMNEKNARRESFRAD